MAATSRSIIDSHIQNLNALSDQRVRSTGELVVVTYPISEIENIYHERETDESATYETGIIFHWDDYRTLLEHTDEYSEYDTPLEATAAVGDHIPVGSVVRVDTKHPLFNIREVPEADDTDVTQASATYINDGNDTLTLTLSTEVDGEDAEGILGNDWTLFVNLMETPPAGFFDEHNIVEVDAQSHRVVVNAEEAVTYFDEVESEWVDGNYGTYSSEIAGEGIFYSRSTVNFTSNPVFPFSGGTGHGIGQDRLTEYNKLEYINQSTEFRVVRNQIRHDEYTYHRHLTMVPNRGEAY